MNPQEGISVGINKADMSILAMPRNSIVVALQSAGYKATAMFSETKIEKGLVSIQIGAKPF